MTYDRGPASLARLAALLRQPDRWVGFQWDHRNPQKNAVGLAFRTWGGPKCFDDSNEDYKFILAKLLGCSRQFCDTVLFTHLPNQQQTYRRGLLRKITPEMVADAIEARIERSTANTPHPLLEPSAA